MENRYERELLQRALERASQRQSFLAGDLAAYRSVRQMSEDELAAYLACSFEALARLALCRRPDPAAPSFAADLERIASYVGVDHGRLAELLAVVASAATMGSRPPGDA